MRNILWVAILLLAGCSGAKHAQTDTAAQDNTQKAEVVHPAVEASPDTLPLRQIDGSILHVVGYGNIFISYTETIDGYTVVRNDQGLYEYAEHDNEGDLKPGGVLAHDPDKRDKKEKKYLNKAEKHLRFTGKKLEKLLEHQKNHENSTIRKLEFYKDAPEK